MRRLLILAVALAALAAPGPAAAARWCGNDALASDRHPEGVGGKQVHVIYATPSDGPDRFAELASSIVTDLEVIDAWWRREDPFRRPRFDVFAFPGGCDTELGRLDLSSVRLPLPGAQLRPLASRLELLAATLARAGGHGSGAKKYLVYYDGPVDTPNVCGTGYSVADRGGELGYAAVWLGADPGCGTGGYRAITAVHELLHTLGAVPRQGPPHPCPGDPSHTCEERDVMGPSSPFENLSDLVLDVGRDDYYGHGKPWWDVRLSPWLAHLDAPLYPLSVSLVGGGTVTSGDPGIECPEACRIDWQAGEEVTLEPQPADDQTRFVRWSGDCAGASADACTLQVDGPLSATAVFGPTSFTLSIRVTGRGSVTGAGHTCRSVCAFPIDADARVRLAARTVRGWRFAGWAGACSGTKACVVRLSAARSVRATFRKR